MKEDLMFYSAYEDFYSMAAKSAAFGEYCREAFGEDFSQDGFSDISQINRIIKMLPDRPESDILDIGCGNGKLLRYLRQELSCRIFGFDYSENAIKTAKALNNADSNFRVGVSDDIIYPDESFDAVLSMDSIYFTNDMPKLIGKIFSWLKPNGIFIAGYEEGDVMPRTLSADTSVIAQSFRKNRIEYTYEDISEETYGMLCRKRETIQKYKSKFDKEGISMWYDVVLHQTDSVLKGYEEYHKNNARYIFKAIKS